MLPSRLDIQRALPRLREAYRIASSFDSGIEFDTLHKKDDAFEHFQPIFCPDNVSSISVEDFQDFLDSKNNHHWYGLQRQGKSASTEMDKLRRALCILVDESRPISKRLDRVLLGGPEHVHGLGLALTTAILLIVFPLKYGSMDKASIDGAKCLGLLPEYKWGETMGERYKTFNHMLFSVNYQLKTDLWTINLLLYVVLKYSL